MYLNWRHRGHSQQTPENPTILKSNFSFLHWGKNVTHLVSYLDLPAATQTILPVFWLPATTHWDQLKSQIPGGTCWIIWRWSTKAAGKNVKRLQCEPPVLQGQHRTQHYNKNEPEPQAHFSPFDTVNSSRIKTHHSSETEVCRRGKKQNKTLKNSISNLKVLHKFENSTLQHSPRSTEFNWQGLSRWKSCAKLWIRGGEEERVNSVFEENCNYPLPLQSEKQGHVLMEILSFFSLSIPGTDRLPIKHCKHWKCCVPL